MADVHSKEARSYNMSRIKGKDTKPEILVRKFLFSQGLRYKLHEKDLPGKPDIVFPKYKKVLFVNGCFWHAHKGCKYFVIPKTRREWWLQKLESTAKKDIINKELLNQLGWTSLVVWECELKRDKRDTTLKNLFRSIVTQRVS